MTYHGIVKQGVIVLEGGVILPDGMYVDIVMPESTDAADQLPPGKRDIFDFDKYAVDTGIPDLALNHDHYLYGLPKVSDGE